MKNELKVTEEVKNVLNTVKNLDNLTEEETDILVRGIMQMHDTRFKKRPVKSIEWNNCDDVAIVETHRVNQKNAWVTDRINVTGDRVDWSKMSERDRDQFVKTFVILSRIDNEQATVGMSELADNSPCKYTSAVFRYQAGMEIVHSESYNRQLATFISTQTEGEYIEWANNNEEVDRVIGYLIERIANVKYEENPQVSFLLQTAFSTALESYLFFLLFYYPLYEANVKNRMNRCAEVIRLILRDESVHGAFSGYIFRKYLKEETEETQLYVKQRFEEFMETLYSRVETMLRTIYTDEFVIADIQRFANYNFNRTLANLGYEPVFVGEDIDFHPALKKEVDEGTDVTHDIFSMVGNTYFMMQSEEVNADHLSTILSELEERDNRYNGLGVRSFKPEHLQEIRKGIKENLEEVINPKEKVKLDVDIDVE